MVVCQTSSQPLWTVDFQPRRQTTSPSLKNLCSSPPPRPSLSLSLSRSLSGADVMECLRVIASGKKRGYWTARLSRCNQSALMEFTKTGYSGRIAGVMHGSKSHSLSTCLCSEWWESHGEGVVSLVAAQRKWFKPGSYLRAEPAIWNNLATSGTWQLHFAEVNTCDSTDPDGYSSPRAQIHLSTANETLTSPRDHWQTPRGALLSFTWFPAADPSPRIKWCLPSHAALRGTSWQAEPKPVFILVFSMNVAKSPRPLLESQNQFCILQ